ncbi:hypothetical protein [Streptomyces sp. NPDC088141]|uniref:hypothetical protein n=1 Tax=Streptomyces sp. NPDC088141 TaxID=3155179 RepID=UPI003432C504
MPLPAPWSKSELQHFVNDGLLIRRGLVAGPLLTRAVGLIDRWYREEFDPE